MLGGRFDDFPGDSTARFWVERDAKDVHQAAPALNSDFTLTFSLNFENLN
jgi:hypothetical protein